ncbi:hypothetical protein V8E54_008397 [Elaphomyces granulatus]
MSIALHHADCYFAFQKLCEAAQGSKQYRNILDEFDKYSLWAGNVGAAHSGKTYKLSLDYRLREASLYKEQVFKLLDILKHQAEKSHQILRGKRIPFEEMPSCAGASFQVGVKDPNVEEDSPWELSSDSETEYQEWQPGTRNVKAQGKTSQETIEGQTQRITELQQLLESIRLAVTYLYKLPLRRPAPLDRLGDRSTEEVSYYQYFDILYVRDKFPDLDDQVQVRLGKMITRRRQLLLYRERHKDNLRTDVASNFQLVAPSEERKKPAKETNKSDVRLAPEVQSEPESSHITFKTKASTLRMEALPFINTEDLFAPSVAESDSKTSLAASRATREIRVEVPPRGNSHEGLEATHFECKYCFLTQYIRSDRAWKEHVLKDLQPYVCTHSDCNIPDHLFENRDAWFSHEIKHHRCEFFCNVAGHQTYTQQNRFEIHLKQDHGIQLNNSSAGIDGFRRPSQSVGGLCNLCFRYTKNLKSHVSRHLHQVALFAVPRADYSAGDEELNGDQSMSQKNSRGSGSLGKQDAVSQNSWRSSDALGDSASGNETTVAENYEGEPLEQVEVPSTAEVTWDVVTEKFSRAREGYSELAPIAVIADTSGESIFFRISDDGQQLNGRTLMRLRSHIKDWTSTKKFIPTKVIEEAITDATVRAIIEEENIETDAEKLSSEVSRSASRLFTTLVRLGKCQDIVLFLTEGIRDIDLPFMEDEREGYKLQTSTGKSITSFLRWDTSSLKDFYKEQWAVLIFQRLL